MASTFEFSAERFRAWRASLAADLRAWVREDWRWYLMSFLFHLALILLIAICMALMPRRWRPDEGRPIALDAPETQAPLTEGFDKFEVGVAALTPSKIDLFAPKEYQQPTQTAKHYSNDDEFEEQSGGKTKDKEGQQLGGLGFRIDNLPGPGGGGGLSTSQGNSGKPGLGGPGEGYAGRMNKGHRDAMKGTGATQATDRAVAGGINWLARHQNANGAWSLQHNRRCATGGACSSPGSVHSDVAATALALLPFLAAGQTHKGGGPYTKVVSGGLFWLAKRQRDNGDLADGGDAHMYTHALATIALCEAFGMTRDEKLGIAAQRGIHFIEAAQNPTTGSWRYEPGDPGDTSVYGWAIMALRSAQMAGLAVNSMTVETSRKWLPMVAKGEKMGLFSYQPYREVTPTMTAVGLLCTQYLGVARDHPSMIEGRQYLLANLPDNDSLRSVYYWYYATLAMHNFMGPEWDIWNRRTRKVLVLSQCHGGCAEGSWDPVRPTLDTWAEQGGRLMMTSLATLTLEVYYRYLPLFNVDKSNPVGRPADTNAVTAKDPAPQAEAPRAAARPGDPRGGPAPATGANKAPLSQPDVTAHKATSLRGLSGN